MLCVVNGSKRSDKCVDRNNPSSNLDLSSTICYLVTSIFDNWRMTTELFKV